MNPFDAATLPTTISAVMVAYVLVWSCLQTFNVNRRASFVQVWAQLIVYYGGYTMPWLWVWLGLPYAHGIWPLWVTGLLLLLSVVYFYTVVVAPHRLQVRQHTVDLGLTTPVRVAVLANLRLGLYSGKPRHIRQLIQQLKRQPVDALLITGEWLYHNRADVVGQLMLLRGLNCPVYTTLWQRVDQAHNAVFAPVQLLEDDMPHALQALNITNLAYQDATLQGLRLCGTNTVLPTCDQTQVSLADAIPTPKLILLPTIECIPHHTADAPYTLTVAAAQYGVGQTTKLSDGVLICADFGQRGWPFCWQRPCLEWLNLR